MEDTDLQLAPPPDETNPLIKWAIAGVVMILIGLAIVFLNPRKTAEVTVQNVALFAPPPVAETPDTVMYPGTAKPAEDDLYVVATVQITDKLRLPIIPASSTGLLTTADGNGLEANFITPADLPRLVAEFPALGAMVNKPGAPPIVSGETIAPGATRTGTVVLLFPTISEAAWHGKKSATLTINLNRQKSVTVELQ